MVIVVVGSRGRGRDGDSGGIGGGWLLMVGVIVQVDIGALVGGDGGRFESGSS